MASLDLVLDFINTLSVKDKEFSYTRVSGRSSSKCF
jgi:hypothetical protein